MRIEKGIISSSQLMFLIIGLIQGSTLDVAILFQISKLNTWLISITGALVTLPFVFCYIVLSQKFPGKNLVEINEIIYGRYIGRLISAGCVCFFLFIFPISTRYVGDFIISYFLPETPLVVFMIMFTLICAWAARSGIEVIARCSAILVILALLITLITILLLLKDMKLVNFLPAFQLNLKDFIQSNHIMSTIPYGEIVVFLMINSYVNDVKQIKKATLLGLLIGSSYLLIVILRNTAVLGNLSAISSSPELETMRRINVGKVLTRLEALYVFILLITVFIKNSIFYYSTLLGTAQLFNLRDYKHLTFPIGVIMISLAMLSYSSVAEQLDSVARVYPIYASIFEFIVPVLSLIILWIRKLKT